MPSNILNLHEKVTQSNKRTAANLTIWLSDPDDQLRVKRLSQPLGMDQLHCTILQSILDVGEYRFVPSVQHQLQEHKQNKRMNPILEKQQGWDSHKFHNWIQFQFISLRFSSDLNSIS